MCVKIMITYSSVGAEPVTKRKCYAAKRVVHSVRKIGQSSALLSASRAGEHAPCRGAEGHGEGQGQTSRREDEATGTMYV